MRNTDQLITVLSTKVPPGCVTTYALTSHWGYDVPNKNQPVRSMLNCARNRGYTKLTNRVVASDGSFADLPDGPAQQRAQLRAEGIPFTVDGKVDFTRCNPIQLKD